MPVRCKGRHIGIRLKPQAPHYYASNCDDVKLFSYSLQKFRNFARRWWPRQINFFFPNFQQLRRNDWCRFSQVPLVGGEGGWTLCFTGEKEPAACVLAYRIKLMHYWYCFIINLCYITETESRLLAETQSSKPLDFPQCPLWKWYIPPEPYFAQDRGAKFQAGKL